MANRHIITRMHQLLDSYEAGEVLPSQVEQAMDKLVGALEDISLREEHAAGDFCYRLMTAHMSMGDEEFYDAEVVADVIKEFRAFISSLPE